MATPTCTCPDGFTYNSNTGQCEQVTYTTIFPPANPFVVGAGNQDGAYDVVGARFYEDITNKVLPIYTPNGNNTPSFSGGFTVLDGIGNPLTYTSHFPSSDSIWKGNKGRLHTSGIWTTEAPLPLKTWIGFTFCITIQTPGDYCIGMAGDNAVRFSINGQPIVSLDSYTGTTTRIYNGTSFTNWHIFPITLSAGIHIIQLEGYNNESVASFGAEIYHASAATLKALISTAALNPYIIFSTKDKVGLNFETGDSSVASRVYTCPTGSIVSSCGSYQCATILQQPCNYLIKLTPTCSTPDNIHPVIVTDNSDFIPYIDKIVTVTVTGGEVKISLGSQGFGTGGGFGLFNNGVIIPNSFFTLTDFTNIQQTVDELNSVFPFLAFPYNLITCIGGVSNINLTEYTFNIPITTLNENTFQLVAFGGTPIISIEGTWGPIGDEQCYLVTSTDTGIVNPLIGTVITEVQCEDCSPQICYTLTDSCTDSPSVVVSNNLAAYANPTLKVKFPNYAPSICWDVTEGGNCDNSVGLIPIEDATIYNGPDPCLDCNPICYLLTDCASTNPHDPVIVTNDLSVEEAAGSFVRTDYFGDICWSISIAPTCISSVTVPVDSPFTAFDTCFLCKPNIAYQLTNCVLTIDPPIITYTDLSALVGKTINNLVVPLMTIPAATCWTISLYGPYEAAIAITSTSLPYENCECCLPQPPAPPIPPPAKIIPEPVRIFYRIDESQCDIDANKKFGEAYSKLVIKKRFGLTTSCKGINFEQVWLSKELSNLTKLIDPDYCPQQIAPCFPNPCHVISTCCQVTKCNVCNPCSSCNPCNSQVPCDAPTSDFPGERCYAKITIESFIPCITPDTLSTFIFQIEGIHLAPEVSLDCYKTQAELQADINAVLYDTVTTRVVILSFDATGITFYLEKVYDVVHTASNACVIYNTDETVCEEVICKLLPPVCGAPIPLPTDEAYWLWIIDGYFRQADGSKWLL